MGWSDIRSIAQLGDLPCDGTRSASWRGSLVDPGYERSESPRSLIRQIRLSIIGFGTVGRWLAAAIDRRRLWLEAECGAAVTVVSVATRRDGFIYRDAGLELPTLLDLASAGRPLADYPGTRRWETAL